MAWMKRAACGSHAGPLWPSATRRWAVRPPKAPQPAKVASLAKAPTKACLVKGANRKATGVSTVAIVAASVEEEATADLAAKAAAAVDGAATDAGNLSPNQFHRRAGFGSPLLSIGLQAQIGTGRT